MCKYLKNNIYLILCFALFIYWILFQIIYPHILSGGDSGAIFLYSRLVAEEFTLLSTNYYYPTELRFLWPSTFYAPFFYVFDDYNHIRLFANTSMYIALLLSFIYVIKQYDIDIKYAFLAMVLFFIPVSNHYLYVNLIVTFYPISCIIHLLYFALLLKIVDTEKNKLLYIILYSLLIFIGSLNGIKVLIYIFVPLLWTSILLVIFFKFFHKNIKVSLNYVFYSFTGFIVSLIGYLINDKLLRELVSFYNFTQNNLFQFNITEKSLEKVLMYFKQIFSIYYWNDFLSIISNICIFISIIIFLYIIYYILRNTTNIPVIFLVLFCIVLIIEQVGLAFFFKGYKAKYFYPVTVFIPVIVSLYACLFKKHIKQNIILLLFISSLLIHGGITLHHTCTSDFYTKQNYPIYPPYVAKDLYKPIEFIIKNNITFGYGTYNEVHLINQLTNGNIEGGPINIDKCNFYRMKWDTLVRYFNNDDLNQKSYFIISNKVYDKCKEKNTLLKENNYQYRDTIYTIYVLEKNTIIKHLR